MTNYALTFSFSTTDVASIVAAGQAVTIVRSVACDVATSDGHSAPVVVVYLPVAWLQFSPSNQNTVTWNGEFSVFATNAALQPGQVIQQNATAGPPIDIGIVYELANDVIQTSGQGADAAYILANGQGETSNLGLAQQGTIDGDVVNSPLAAIVVLNDETATFVPSSTCSVFLETYYGNGVVINGVPDQALVVTLDAATPSALLAFDDVNNTFYIGPM